MRDLKVRSIMVGHRKLTVIDWEVHGSWSLKTTWKVTEVNVSSSIVSWHLKQIGKVKKLNKWLSCELTKKQNKTKQNHCFKMLSSLILCNSEPLLNQIVKCNEKWIVYSNQQQPAQWGAEKKFQHTSGSQTCTPVWLLLPSDPLRWIPVKLLQLRIMLSKSMRCTENGNDCSQLWSTERNQSFFRTKSDHTSHNQHFKSWMNWVTEFCFICHVHLTLSNRLPLLQATQQLFAGKMLLQPAGDRKCFLRVCWIPKHGILCYRDKQTYFPLGKNVLIVMVHILINKVVFTYNYNDLKFTVQITFAPT